MTIYCTRCGAANNDDASFCCACGKTLTPPNPAHAQPPPPAKKRINPGLIILIISLALLLIDGGLLAIALTRENRNPQQIGDIKTGVIAEDINNTGDDGPGEDIEAGGFGEEEDIDNGNDPSKDIESAGSEEEEDDEDEDAYPSMEVPDFIIALQSGIYGYECYFSSYYGAQTMEMTETRYADISQGFMLHAAKIVLLGLEMPRRTLIDTNAGIGYAIDDSELALNYRLLSDDLVNRFINDRRYDSMIEVGRGTADIDDEMLPYIDYDVNGSALRFFIKDGDVYAMNEVLEIGMTRTSYITRTGLTPPPEVLVIPDHYKQLD